MKLENLAIIFIILILPISIILEEYTKSRVDTIKLQAQYDSKLNSSTYDAIKAYQLNNFSSSESALVNSRMRDIKAAANSFFTSLGNNFSDLGYTKNNLEAYVPAIVFTMYDGYYIYSPYTNTLSMTEKQSSAYKGKIKEYVNVPDQITKYAGTDGEDLYGVKPYIYYSARYSDGSSNDIVITYSLDNYVSIVGKLDGKYENVGGYLISGITANASPSGDEIYSVNYNCKELGINVQIPYEKIGNDPINGDNYDCEYVCVGTSSDPQYLPCVKVNGNKYYKLPNTSNYDIKDDAGNTLVKKGDVFCLNNGKPSIQQDPGSSSLSMEDGALAYRIFYPLNEPEANYENRAQKYYYSAMQFQEFINNHSFLKNLTLNDMVYIDGKNYNDTSTNKEFLNFKSSFTQITGKIFDYDNSKGIESSVSNFNLHRIDVIKYAIESNLSVAISNYNDYSVAGQSTDFRMPKLKDIDWDKITNNIGMITFLQGMNIGGKVYNGYSVVPNTKNMDVVSEDSIYILNRINNTIHDVAEYKDENNVTITSLEASVFMNNYARGVFNVDYEKRVFNKLSDSGDVISKSYYPIICSLSYYSVVTQSRVGNKNDILKNSNHENKELVKIYFTALR